MTTHPANSTKIEEQANVATTSQMNSEKNSADNKKTESEYTHYNLQKYFYGQG